MLSNNNSNNVQHLIKVEFGEMLEIDELQTNNNNNNNSDDDGTVISIERDNKNDTYRVSFDFSRKINVKDVKVNFRVTRGEEMFMNVF